MLNFKYKYMDGWNLKIHGWLEFNMHADGWNLKVKTVPKRYFKKLQAIVGLSLFEDWSQIQITNVFEPQGRGLPLCMHQ